MYERIIEQILMLNICDAVLDTFSLSSLTIEHSLIAYVVIPKEAAKEKYDTYVLAKLYFPTYSGRRTLETYGKVIIGSLILVIVFIIFHATLTTSSR